MGQTYYTPGVCNINEAEVSYRRLGGHLFAAGTVSLLILMIIFNIEPAYAIFLTLPASIAALQYLQVANRFCTRYALQHKYSDGDGYKESGRVADELNRKMDKVRSAQLMLQAAFYGVLSALLSIILLLAL